MTQALLNSYHLAKLGSQALAVEAQAGSRRDLLPSGEQPGHAGRLPPPCRWPVIHQPGCPVCGGDPPVGRIRPFGVAFSLVNGRAPARGRAAHSAYPEMGESAIEKLLDTLSDLRAAKLPEDATLGASTLNIGRIAGGVAATRAGDK